MRRHPDRPISSAATRPNELWVADLMYVRTWSGFVYVAFVIDAYSRFIVGWQASTSLRTDRPWMPSRWRSSHVPASSRLIHHSDRGSQSLSIRYTERLAKAGGVPRSDPKATATTTRSHRRTSGCRRPS